MILWTKGGRAAEQVVLTVRVKLYGGKLDSRFAWLVGAALSRLVASFPFTVADTASNRSRKSFVFWQCAVGGAPGYRLVSEFQLPVGDWPRPSNGAVSKQCRVSPTYSTYTPSLPRTPLLATLRSFLALIVTHCLLRLEMWHTTEAICWSTALTTGILFDAPRASWLFGGQAVETTLLPWQWICLRSYACWSSHPLRWKVNKKLGLILAVYVDMTLSEGRFVVWGCMQGSVWGSAASVACRAMPCTWVAVGIPLFQSSILRLRSCNSYLWRTRCCMIKMRSQQRVIVYQWLFIFILYISACQQKPPLLFMLFSYISFFPLSSVFSGGCKLSHLFSFF